MINKVNYVELGLACADACRAIGRGADGIRVEQPSQLALNAIEQLTTWVEPPIHILGGLLTMFSIAVL